jgi:RimJ/RimL family protein N-acetyltransferase
MLFGIKIARFSRRLEGLDIILRLLRPGDLRILRSLFETTTVLQTGGLQTRHFNSLWSFWKWMKTTFQVLYVIEVKKYATPRIIGFAGLYNIRSGQGLSLSLTLFNPEDRRRGYGGRAVEMLMASFRENAVAKTVEAEILKNNLPSQYFFRKAGFEICRPLEP